jgi:ATP-dependent Zn protease
MKMKSGFKVVIFYLVLIIAILWATTALLNTQSDKINFSDIVRYFKNEEVQKFYVDDDNMLYLTLAPKDSSEKSVTVKYELRSVDLFEAYLGNTIREQSEKGIIQSYDYVAPATIPFWVSFLPYIIMKKV